MKNLISKELKVGFRLSGFMVMFSAVLGGFAPIFFSYETVREIKDSLIIQESIKMCALFLPAMLIPMVGTVFLETTLNEERKNRILHVLMASGLEPQNIWEAKIIAASLVAYICIFIPFCAVWLYGLLLFQIKIYFDTRFIIMYFVFIPAIAIAFLNLIGIIMWGSRRGQFLAGFMPLLSYISCLYLSLYLLENKTSINFWILGATTVLAFAVSFICRFIVKRISKEYIVNIEI